MVIVRLRNVLPLIRVIFVLVLFTILVPEFSLKNTIWPGMEITTLHLVTKASPSLRSTVLLGITINGFMPLPK